MSSRTRLLFERGCPFAHRVQALFAHLAVEHDAIEGAPGKPPPELARWSPTGRVPLLVIREVAIGESRVMLEHIAETHAFAEAYPTSILERTLHRELMAIVDDKIAPSLLDPARTLRPARLDEYLDRFELVAKRTPPAAGLLAFHIAPIWLRLQWWRPQGQITKAIRERPVLVAWLDALTKLPAMVATSPSEAENIEDFEAAVCALAASA